MQLEKYDQKPDVEIIVRSQTVTVLRPCCATKEHDNLATSEIRVSILLGIGVIARFYLSCRVLADRIGLWSAECGQVNQHQHVFAAQRSCAKTFKSNVGSGDSALGISPILRLRFIM